MAEGNDRRLDPTARNRHASGEDRPHGRDERDERFSRPKEIPDHILDGIELPSAPCDEPRPVPGKSAKVRRPSSRPVAGLLRKARPAPAPASLSGPGPRRPGQRVPSKPAVRETTSNTLLSGAQLFQKGAELPAIGEFAGYQVLGRLAIGGMAEILLARQPGQAEPIVLKKILATFDSDDEFVEMFLDEARVGMQLEHPNIGHFLDAGEERGRYFIAMEWVNGVTLAKLVRRASKSGGIPPTIASAIVRAVADALHYAHTSRDENDDLMGLIHRDVSPHNIMVGYDGTVKLLDFGIAKAMGAAHITAAGVVKGKFAYMAPEQCEGEAIDFRSDIFALGVVLFEALTGKRLFRRGSDRETVRAIVREPVPSLSEHWVKAPRELEAICSTALNKDPTARFPTSAAMRDVLTLFIENQRADVSQQRIAELVQSIFADELRDGPNVDSSLSGDLDPVSYSVSRSIQESSPTLGPPPLSSPALDLPNSPPSHDPSPSPFDPPQFDSSPFDASPFDAPVESQPRLDTPVESQPPVETPVESQPPVDKPTVMRHRPEPMRESQPPVDKPTVMRHRPEPMTDSQPPVDKPTVMRHRPEPMRESQPPLDPPTVMQHRPDPIAASELPLDLPTVMQSQDRPPRRDETPTRCHPLQLAEPEHAWTEESTAIQSARERDAVLEQIQKDRARESSEWPTWAAKPKENQVGGDVASAAPPRAMEPIAMKPVAMAPMGTEPVAMRQAPEEPEPEGRLSAVELAPIKGTSKYAADVLIVLFALSLAAGLVWFFAMD